ncbi:hypothetical protein UFOVP1020_7 [uncultured Caudovirales phage]|uniref:Uncharacterized protein n=1 Tax=uncultured Caudovirales phage TaxID=2100421 RepID=A0A6J5QZ30_9CAUD|nr:hypothetical protein UFOVP512_12 [uncultured Caudovirales phage]CAB4178666.1 hypothetical protein UFOVP1020_7 [uncultured Caudovirales phage]CAB4187837.1 hypothetical protein UFOVP1170_2 [uncultured Caudovirales phage]CAB4220536.1 hypothetical protein UFOVP1621_43 [uncultured Caudovirales phage]
MSRHTINAVIPVGDPDLGAAIDCRITFTFHGRVEEQGPSYASGGQPAEGAVAEWMSAVAIEDGKPAPYGGHFAELEQSSLDSIASAWLESDEGQAQAIEQALDDLQEDLDRTADDRAEQRAEDRRDAR